VAANHNGSTFFTPWNFDQAGLELAWVRNRTSVSATLFNGLCVKADEGAFKAFPAAGGELVKAGGFSKADRLTRRPENRAPSSTRCWSWPDSRSRGAEAAARGVRPRTNC